MSPTRLYLVPGALCAGLALLLPFVLTLGLGCGKDGASLLAVVDASGGDGHPTDGVAGGGGFVDLRFTGSGSGSIEVLDTGRVDASFTPSSPTADLGPNPLLVTTSMSILLATVEPGAGVAYAIGGYGNLFISDGNGELADEDPVSGVRISPGATLTMPINGITTATYSFFDDFVNDGVLTVPTISPFERGNLELRPDRYIGKGDIRVFGTSPGMPGGVISVRGLTGIFNAGDWLAYGADATNDQGGQGGIMSAWILAGPGAGAIENTGRMDCHGGNVSGTAGTGGQGGQIYIEAYAGVSNSGDIDVSGGDGFESGGQAGWITMVATHHGDLLNTGDLDGIGGKARADFGDGGAGALMELGAHGGEIRMHARIDASGGLAAGELRAGGSGGVIGINTFESDDTYEAFDAPPGEIWLSGALLARGGDALAAARVGGTGGQVVVRVNDKADGQTQSIHLLGMKRIDVFGGDGGQQGGQGGSIRLIGDDTVTDVVVEPPMNAWGGDADPNRMGSMGGDGGVVDIFALTIEYGAANADGGMGSMKGTPGLITPETMMP